MRPFAVNNLPKIDRIALFSVGEGQEYRTPAEAQRERKIFHRVERKDHKARYLDFFQVRRKADEL